MEKDNQSKRKAVPETRRKLIAQIMVSLDGYMEGKNRDLDWHVVDEEYNQFASAMLNAAGGLVFGRSTYEHMAQFWPTVRAKELFEQVAERMNHLPKLVFSRTLQETAWSHSELISGAAVQRLELEKQQRGKPLLILGSAGLVSSITSQAPGLIDEYQIIVNPVLLGAGRPYFQGLTEHLTLELIESRSFNSGNVLLVYRCN